MVGLAAAGIAEHIEHKKISGLAWLGLAASLRPLGSPAANSTACSRMRTYRRHSKGAKWKKPNHVIEHEAEVFAHRALRRYGLEVPEKSTMSARNYVAQ